MSYSKKTTSVIEFPEFQFGCMEVFSLSTWSVLLFPDEWIIRTLDKFGSDGIVCCIGVELIQMYSL